MNVTRTLLAALVLALAAACTTSPTGPEGAAPSFNSGFTGSGG
jgi:hypothetical protein